MKTKEEFKEFVNNNPEFAQSVINGKISWQKLFELFNLYDEDSKVFDKYREKEREEKSNNTISSILNIVKGINLDNFQSNLTNIQKAVSFLEEFTRKDEKSDNKTKENLKDSGNIDSFYRD